MQNQKTLPLKEEQGQGRVKKKIEEHSTCVVLQMAEHFVLLGVSKFQKPQRLSR